MSLRQWEKIVFINLACVVSVSAGVYCAKTWSETPPPPKKKKMEVGGGGGKVSFPPLPLLLFIYFYFCSRSTFRALSRAKSLGTQVIINWVDKVLAALHAPRCRVGVSISEDRQLYLQARPPQGGREAVISSASPPRTHSPPPATRLHPINSTPQLL